MLDLGWGALSRGLDDLSTVAWSLLSVERGFARTGAGAPPTFEALIGEVGSAPPRVAWPVGGPGRPARVPVALPAAGGATFFDWLPARRAPGAPPPDTLVVFHHGLGEVPHDTVPRLVRLHPALGRLDWAVLKALHHESPRATSARFTRDLAGFARALVASAATARAIANAQRARYRRLVFVGVSLGGLVGQVEGLADPRFDLYVPIVSGPDLRDVLLRSSFARTVQAGFRRRARAAPWLAELDLSARLARVPADGPPLRPLLARADGLFRLGPQTAAWARVPRARVTTCAGGHLTGVANLYGVARHLQACLDELDRRRAPAGADARAASPALARA